MKRQKITDFSESKMKSYMSVQSIREHEKDINSFIEIANKTLENFENEERNIIQNILSSSPINDQLTKTGQ